MALEPRLDDALRRGLKRMARSTSTWILTGGMNVGVMDYVGDAIGGFGDTPCIGIPAVQKVRGWDKKWPEDSVQPDGKIEVINTQNFRTEDDAKSRSVRAEDAELEEHHTHFLFVDNPEVKINWGGELAVARIIRHIMSSRFRIPLVTLVIGGTVGNLEDVLDALDSEGRGTVVVIRESGGCAQALAEFTKDYLMLGAEVKDAVSGSKQSETAGSASKQHNYSAKVRDALDRFVLDQRLEKLLISDLKYDSTANKDAKRKKAKKLLSRIAEHYRVESRLHVYSLQGDGASGNFSQFARADIDTHLLEAVVDSMFFDVEIDSRAKAVSTVRRILCNPAPQVDRMCMTDDTSGSVKVRAREGQPDAQPCLATCTAVAKADCVVVDSCAAVSPTPQGGGRQCYHRLAQDVMGQERRRHQLPSDRLHLFSHSRRRRQVG